MLLNLRVLLAASPDIAGLCGLLGVFREYCGRCDSLRLGDRLVFARLADRFNVRVGARGVRAMPLCLVLVLRLSCTHLRSSDRRVAK